MEKPSLCGYVGLYNGKTHKFRAETSLEAWKLACAFFKAPKSKAHLVSVMLAEIDGKPVIHRPDF